MKKSTATAPREREKRSPRVRSKRFTLKVTADPTTLARISFALRKLERDASLRGARSKRLSVRVDPGLVAEARRRTGIAKDSELVNAALAVIAAPDGFGAWFVAQAGRLDEDFELAL